MKRNKQKFLVIIGILCTGLISKTECVKATSLIFAKTSTTTSTEAPSENEASSSSETSASGNNQTTKSPLTGIPQIDYKWDPNLPRELNGYNLTDYPFYSSVPPPEEMDFKCDGLHDGFYASVPHKCQVYHHCLFGTRYDFLCANYTAFDQKTFICHFASEVDCVNSPKYFHRNDALYQAASTTTTTIAPPFAFPPRRAPTILGGAQQSPGTAAGAPVSSTGEAPAIAGPVEPAVPLIPVGAAYPRRRRPYYRRRRPQYDYYEEDDYLDDYYDDDLPPPPRNRRRKRPRPNRRPDFDEYDDDYDTRYDRRSSYDRRRPLDDRRSSDDRKSHDDDHEDRRRPDDRRRAPDDIDVEERRSYDDRRRPSDEYDRKYERRKSNRQPSDDRRYSSDDDEEFTLRNRRKPAIDDERGAESESRRSNYGHERNRRPSDDDTKRQTKPKDDRPEQHESKPSSKSTSTSSLYNKPRVSPIIRRPMPANDRSKFENTSPKSTTKQPSAVRDEDYYDDYEDEVEEQKPKHSSSTTTLRPRRTDTDTTTHKYGAGRLASTDRRPSYLLSSKRRPADDAEPELEDERPSSRKRPTSVSSTQRTRYDNNGRKNQSPPPEEFDDESYDANLKDRETIPSSTSRYSSNNRKPIVKTETTTKESPRSSTETQQIKKDTYVRIHKRPFLPSRGGNPYVARGLLPVGNKALGLTTTTTSTKKPQTVPPPLEEDFYDDEEELEDRKTDVPTSSVPSRPYFKTNKFVGNGNARNPDTTAETVANKESDESAAISESEAKISRPYISQGNKNTGTANISDRGSITYQNINNSANDNNQATHSPSNENANIALRSNYNVAGRTSDTDQSGRNSNFRASPQYFEDSRSQRGEATLVDVSSTPKTYQPDQNYRNTETDNSNIKTSFVPLEQSQSNTNFGTAVDNLGDTVPRYNFKTFQTGKSFGFSISSPRLEDSRTSYDSNAGTRNYNQTSQYQNPNLKTSVNQGNQNYGTTGQGTSENAQYANNRGPQSFILEPTRQTPVEGDAIFTSRPRSEVRPNFRSEQSPFRTEIRTQSPETTPQNYKVETTDQRDPLDITENEYDVNLNDALNPTLPIPSRHHPSGFLPSRENDYSYSNYQRPRYLAYEPLHQASSEFSYHLQTPSSVNTRRTNSPQRSNNFSSNKQNKNTPFISPY